MTTFNNAESGSSVRTKINNVLQHADGTASELVINEAGADVNFRVESDTNANALFVDGGTGFVGIGTSSLNPSARLGVQGGRVYLDAPDEFTLRLSKSGVAGGFIGTSAVSTLNFYNGTGTERMRIDASGNVGIGLTNPGGFGAKFAVAGDVVINENTPQLYLRSNATANLGAILFNNGLTFNDSGVNERMRITSTGNVGIGTSSPASTLTVNGGVQLLSTNTLSFTNTAEQVYIRAPGTNLLAFGTDSTERLRITNTGNVGIGTSSPTGNLTIGGAAPSIHLLETGGSAGFNNTVLTRDADSFIIQTRNGATFVSSDYLMTTNASGATAHAWRIGNTERMRVDSTGNVGIGETAPDYKLDVNGAIGFTPGASVTPVDNGDVVFELTNNTTLTVKAKGSDGVVRSATLTLA